MMDGRILEQSTLSLF